MDAAIMGGLDAIIKQSHEPGQAAMNPSQHLLDELRTHVPPGA
jgi:hypothetical protein